MIRQTSLDTYRQIRDQGLLSQLRFHVYSTLFENGPLTANEVRKITGLQQNSVNPRTAELLRLGVIRPYEERPCSVTGRVCIAWQVTDELPVKTDPGRKLSGKAKIKMLEAQIQNLESILLQCRCGDQMRMGGIL